MKNFVYNKSDILIALLIIVVAAVVIWTRVDVIMGYPETALAAAKSSAETSSGADADATNGALLADADAGANTGAGVESPAVTPDADGSASGSSTGGNASTDTSQNASSQPPQTSGQTSGQGSGSVKLVVNAGESTATIADKLVAAGLVSSKSEFLIMAAGQGADRRMLVGTFTIPAGSTYQEIIDILTGK